MAKNNSFVDDAGRQVIDFAASCRTLGKVGELADNIRAMAESGSWRRYRTAVGTTTWRACEFDYFLISCDLEYDDVYRAIKWDKLGDATRAMMDQNAPLETRRPFQQAAAAYKAAGPETLIARAERLQWITKSGRPRSPLSQRQIAKQAAGGKSAEQQALERRRERLSQEQRRELDRLADELAVRLDNDEFRYLIAALRREGIRRGPVHLQRGDREQWAADIAELNGSTQALAKRWNLSDRAVRRRKAEL